MDMFPVKYSCGFDLVTRTSITGEVDGTSKVLDNSNKLLPGCFLFSFLVFFSLNGAAPLSKLWRASSEKATVLLLSVTAPMWSKSHLSRRKRSRFSICDRDEVLLLLFLSPCFSSLASVRSPKKSVFCGSGVSKHSNTQTPLVSQIKASVSVFLFRRLAGSYRSQLCSSLVADQSCCRCLCVVHVSVCVGLCAALRVRELTPKHRFSPLLSATTRMYHHVTVQWIVLSLQCVNTQIWPPIIEYLPSYNICQLSAAAAWKGNTHTHTLSY